MNVWGRMKVVWADILQVSVVSSFNGAASCGWCRENGGLLTEDLDGCLDCKGHQKTMITYSWLRAAGDVCFDCSGVGRGRMRYSERVVLGAKGGKS